MTNQRAGEPPLDQPWVGAPFGAAFRRFWKKGFTFSGRASRSEYWKSYLVTIGLVAGLLILGNLLLLIGWSAYANDPYSGSALLTTTLVMSQVLTWTAFLYALAALIPSLAAAVRRLHDANQSGGVYFISFIPLVGSIILLVILAQESNPAGSRFDLAGGAATPGSLHYGAPPLPVTAALTRGNPMQAEASVRPVPPPPPPPAPAVSVPAIWAPPAPPAPVAASAPIAPVAYEPSSSLDETRISNPASAGGWVVELPDGRRLPVEGSLIFGRDPISEPGTAGAIRVPVDDSRKSMSKTHARIDSVAGALTVTDLHSTNGTTVTDVAGVRNALAPGVPHPVNSSAELAFGDYVVRVRRS